MKMSKFAQMFLHKNNIALLFLHLIFATTCTTANDKIQHIFDQTIEQFVKQFSVQQKDHPTTSSSSKDGQHHLQVLTYQNAADILKEIEEKVANKVLKAERQIANLKFDYIMFEIQLGMAQKSRREETRLIFVKPLDALHLVEQDLPWQEHTALLHLLLTFAIQMGFHIGRDGLNAERNGAEGAAASHIHLHNFNQAQILIKKRLTLTARYPMVLFEAVPAKQLVKLNMAPGQLWNEWQIEYNLETIRMLIDSPNRRDIGEWLSFVKQIHALTLNGRFRVWDPLKTISTLDRLMVGWTGWSNYKIDVVTFCAVKTFGRNLLKRLSGFEKVEAYIAENAEKGVDTGAILKSLNADLETHCNYEKFI